MTIPAVGKLLTWLPRLRGPGRTEVWQLLSQVQARVLATAVTASAAAWAAWICWLAACACCQGLAVRLSCGGQQLRQLHSQHTAGTGATSSCCVSYSMVLLLLLLLLLLQGLNIISGSTQGRALPVTAARGPCLPSGWLLLLLLLLLKVPGGCQVPVAGQQTGHAPRGMREADGRCVICICSVNIEWQQALLVCCCHCSCRSRCCCWGTLLQQRQARQSALTSPSADSVCRVSLALSAGGRLHRTAQLRCRCRYCCWWRCIQLHLHLFPLLLL